MKKIAAYLLLFLVMVSCTKKTENVSPNASLSVLYNGNSATGGEVPIDPTKYNANSSATVLANTGGLVKTGFTFNGWNTSASGTGNNYAPGSTLALSNSSITLYANWLEASAATYRIIYNGNGNTSGTPPVDPLSYTNGDKGTVLANTSNLSKNGVAFQQWNTSPNGSGTTYKAGDKITVQSSDITLYAIYNAATSGLYLAIDSYGHLVTKSSLATAWSTQSNRTSDFDLVSITWDGALLAGFDSYGHVATKSSLVSTWVTQSNRTADFTLVSVIWDGTQYVGVDSYGHVTTKANLGSTWVTYSKSTADFSLVSIVWDGTRYVGFDSYGHATTKSSLGAAWTTQSNHTSDYKLTSVTWDGSQYVGIDSYGHIATKSTLTSTWASYSNNSSDFDLTAIMYY